MKNRFLYYFLKKCRVVTVTVFFLLLPLPVFSQMYLELNLNDSVSGNMFIRQRSTLEILRVIDKAKKDKTVQGIILNIGLMNRSRENIWELRNALDQFKKSGKKIVAYVNNVNLDSYMLVSVADKIVMDELGEIIMLGYSAGRGYVKQSLDKLGIGVMELRYFEYKSAAESFTRTNYSDADRKQYTDYLDDIYNYTRSILMEARGWTLEEFDLIINTNFMHSAKSAVVHKLVDSTGGFSAVENVISEIENSKTFSYYLFGDVDTSLTGSILSYNAKAKSFFLFNSSIIAIVNANGETDMTRGMEISKISKIINDLGKNNRVKAIVIRINSPGGSAQAAECLAEAINQAKKKKPVVVSMGSVAASGGYWASVNASHIMATPYTITGSIGVIGNWFYDNGLYNNIGVTTDVIKRGDHSDLMTGFLIPYRNLTAQEEEQFKNYILDLYNIFTDKVAAGRNMDKQKVETVAQGRIFSGLSALNEGLIDSVGSLFDAVNVARELANIPEGRIITYREYPEPRLLDILMGNFSVFAKLSDSRTKKTTTFLDLLLPDADIRYRLENNGQIMPIMPLDLF